ncbi:MAG: ABC transporter permease [Victivallaceae bacterium]|nr:ABC transporter permease [Victivallaceae bacterium]
MSNAARNPFFTQAWSKFRRDRFAVAGVTGIALLLALALAAPLITNGKPLAMWYDHDFFGTVSFPFLREIFAPDSPEQTIERFFNYSLLLIAAAAAIRLLRLPKRRLMTVAAATALLVPFFTVERHVDKTDYRVVVRETAAKAVFTPIPYGPFEAAASPYSPPGAAHWLGTDSIGRDVASRMIYGARASLAVGVFATLLALVIGAAVGLAAGFYRGWFDLTVMRLVEIIMCFPTFLLLLILMAALKDREIEQSMILVILVIGLTGWIGLTFLVRGETLKQRNMAYVLSCEVSGIPSWRIMAGHILPNIMPPILISFTFGVAGAILAESGLSFLGFGVQPPTASWGDLLRQAFDNPMNYWHLTLFPGLALFWAVLAFNFTGEGLRKALDAKA